MTGSFGCLFICRVACGADCPANLRLAYGVFSCCPRRQSEAIDPITDDANSIRALCLWLQTGIVNAAAAARAKHAGPTVVMDRCIKLAHQQTFGATR